MSPASSSFAVYVVPLVAGLLLVAAAVSAVAVTVDAFRASLWRGLACLFVPFYLPYHAFVHFRHAQRRGLLWLFFGGPVAAATVGMVPVLLAMAHA